MGYRNSQSSNGSYDSTGRWRSEAWHMDGGANDEGFHDKYCHECYRVTEHGLAEGCVPCGDRAIVLRNRQKVRSVIVSGSTEDHTVRIHHDGTRQCSCKGFQFRKTCKHVGLVYR